MRRDATVSMDKAAVPTTDLTVLVRWVTAVQATKEGEGPIRSEGSRSFAAPKEIWQPVDLGLVRPREIGRR